MVEDGTIIGPMEETCLSGTGTAGDSSHAAKMIWHHGQTEWIRMWATKIREDGSNGRRCNWVWTAWAPKAADTSPRMFYFPKSVQACSTIIEAHGNRKY
jgi:hypothetical protein